MNINIVLDSDYICKKLSSENGAKDIEHLFMIMKQKSNIIIIQDKKQKIINNIIHQLIEELKKENQVELTSAQIFITELAKGTNAYDFITEEVFDNDISAFVNNLKKKNYPLKIIISDKILDDEIESHTLENINKIFETLENHSKEHKITNNKELLSEKKDKQKMVNFDRYKDFLFQTFWCSKKITIIAKEFYDGYFSDKPWQRENNRDRYAEWFKFLFDCFKDIEDFTGKKLNIEIITGLSYFNESDFDLNGEKNVDEIFDFINKLSDKFIFSFKIIKWDAGDERFKGEGHGRRIYSDYGGFKTEYMPFEMHSKRDKFGKIYHKDTACTWTDNESFLQPQQIGSLKSSRPQ